MSGPGAGALVSPSGEVLIERVPSPRPPHLDPVPGAPGSPDGPPGLEALDHRPAKHVMVPIHALFAVAMAGTRTHFEKGVDGGPGAREDIAEHRESGGSLLILMTHVRRREVFAIAQMARVNRSLQHLQYNTGITARSELAELFGPLGYVVRHSGAQFIRRSLENLGETEEEKDQRQAENHAVQAAGGRFLAHGGHWLIYPEGGSKEVVIDPETQKPLIGEDGKKVRTPREPGKLLTIRPGFVDTLASMTPEERSRVKMIGMAAQYGKRRIGIRTFNATLAIPRLVTPLEGDYEDPEHRERVRLQGEDLLQRGLTAAIAIEKARRR